MAITKNLVITKTYRDSVVLMELSRELDALPGIREAAVMMATPANIDVLKNSNLLDLKPDEVSTEDMVIAVLAESEIIASEAINWAKTQLERSKTQAESASEKRDEEKNYVGQWREVPDHAKVSLISVPGTYAASEAWKSLRAGLHTFIFSDHVDLKDELELKRAGRDRKLLVMGPECGTAILGGVPLGFANNVRRGPIGIVAASGSGLQEVTCLIDRYGGGISHAIGTGGRDLSSDIGGMMMKQGARVLADNEDTEVIVLLSKPPGKEVSQDIFGTVKNVNKPVVVCFLGLADEPNVDWATFTRTLEDTAKRAVQFSDVQPQDLTNHAPTQEDINLGSPSLRGLFSGGTLAYEAMVVFEDNGIPVWSNKPLHPEYKLDHQAEGQMHICLDLGAEEYTVGQPHPMIDPTERTEVLVEQAKDLEDGVFLLDFVLGFGSHPDPAGAMLPAIKQVQDFGRNTNASYLFIASVVGTEADVQQRSIQVEKLERQGVLVAPSSTRAAQIAAFFINS